MRILRPSLLLGGSILLLGCAGVARGVLHPPQVRLQEVAVTAEGGVSVAIRAINNAVRTVRFDRLELALSLDGSAPVRLHESVPRELPARSVEIYRFALSPEELRLPPAGVPHSVLYWKLAGQVVVEGQRFPIEAEGRLDPVPGREGLFR